MSSRGKKKTTFAKLDREARLRERRAAKQARRDTRRETTRTSAGPVAAGRDGEHQSPDEAPIGAHGQAGEGPPVSAR